MHLLVLGAFRPEPDALTVAEPDVSMHLLVLSAFRLRVRLSPTPAETRLNAPFGAQCFPTASRTADCLGETLSQCTFWCSVLSDQALFRRNAADTCLNAPFGAQCFPTREH